jgi:hypothetical protein
VVFLVVFWLFFVRFYHFFAENRRKSGFCGHFARETARMMSGKVKSGLKWPFLTGKCEFLIRKCEFLIGTRLILV